MEIKKVTRIAVVTILILLVPIIAMQFTDQVVWDISDFVFASLLLFSAGLAYEFFASKMKFKAHRVILGIVILAIFLIIWAELAVGVFGTPFAGS